VDAVFAKEFVAASPGLLIYADSIPVIGVIPRLSLSFGWNW